MSSFHPTCSGLQEGPVTVAAGAQDGVVEAQTAQECLNKHTVISGLKALIAMQQQGVAYAETDVDRVAACCCNSSHFKR